MTTLQATIIEAKQQLYRDEMLELMGKALRALQQAQARGAWSSTGTHESWKALEEAKEKIADACEIIIGRSGRYIRENGEEPSA